MQLRNFLLFALCVCATTVARGAVIVTAGNHLLLPNTSGQVISVFVTATADEAAHLLDFTAGIDNGVGPAPIITAMNVNGPGTLFDTSVNTSMVFHFGDGFDPPGLEVFQEVEFDDDLLNVPIGADQLLATLTISTAGFASGSWDLNLLHSGFDELSISSTSGALPLTLVNGSITIVPEPATLWLGLLAAIGLATLRSRPEARSGQRIEHKA
jgi:hypothetical protein